MPSILARIEWGALLVLDRRVSARIEPHDVAMDATAWGAGATIGIRAFLRQPHTE